jgi:hypothetical protein
MFDTSQLMAASGSGDFYSHTIDGSLRFNTNDNPQLLKTFASAGNQKTWTMSMWVKIHSPSQEEKVIWGCQTNTYTSEWMRIIQKGSVISWESVTYPDETLRIYLVTDQVFRDPSAWYHLVFKWDSTQATASDRAEIYVNGVAATYNNASSSPTYPSQNYNGFINNGSYPHSLGGVHAYGMVNHMSLAEVNFIDGTALDATSFGEFKSGVWIPKAYSGSYGTNGFYLPLTSDANDDSGNGNNFTENNLASTDYVLDSPTNNFATLGCPIRALYTNAIKQEGNLQTTSTGSSSSFGTDFSTFSIPPNSGKWYVEMYVKWQTTFYPMLNLFDVTNPTQQVWAGQTGEGFSWFATGTTYWNDTQTATRSSFTTGDLLSLAYDSDTGKVFIAKNNTWENSGNPAAGTNPVATLTSNIEVTFAVSVNYSVVAVTNFGQDSSFAGNKTPQGNTDDNGYGDFYYAPPSGYLALCTANLPDPVASIDPAQDGSPQDHFNTVLYTGDFSNSNSITGVGFQPDFLWIKNRNGGNAHTLFDAIRGNTKWLESSSTSAERTTGSLVSFDTDGFTVSSNSYTEPNTNWAATYVAWNWKANGSGVSNTDGSITSTVSANTDAGFSIVSYTGNSTTGATIGHGLGVAPAMIITKNRSTSSRWAVYHHANTSEPETEHLRLNETTATIDALTYWNDTAPTSSVFTVGTDASVNYTGNNMIAYCFAEVDGFSKFGSYTGNGSLDGPFVYTGFRPAFVITKRTNSTSSWYIVDQERSGNVNVMDDYLRSDSANAETTGSTSVAFDFNANGFKVREDGGSNQSGGTYIYMAFAENPFKYANAR